MKRNILSLVTVFILLIATNLFSQLSLEVVWEKPQAGINDAKFSPDGKFIYCAIGKTIKKLDVATGEFIATFDNSLSPFIYANVKMNISDDGKYIATSNSNGAIDIWDTQQNKLIKELQLGANMATFKKDNTILIASGKNESRGIIVYDFLKDKYIDTISYTPAILHIYTSQDGTRLITGSVYKDWEELGHCKITLWDAGTLKPIRDYEVPEGNYNGFRKIQISDNNKVIGLATHNSNIVKILETETGNVVKTSDLEKEGYDFELLPKNYYMIYQENELDINDCGFKIFKYPNIFQSYLKRLASGLLISNETDDYIKVIFCTSKAMVLLQSLTTSVPNNQIGQFNIKVAQEKITVSFENANTIEIIDMQGNIIFSKEVITSSLTIPNTFSPGTYICVVKSGGKEYSQKFQIVK